MRHEEPGQIDGGGTQRGRGGQFRQQRRDCLAVERHKGTAGEELWPVLAQQKAQAVDQARSVTDESLLVPSQDAHLSDRIGYGGQSPQAGVLLASDPSTNSRIDEITLVDLAAPFFDERRPPPGQRDDAIAGHGAGRLDLPVQKR
jgi:hypothetical protein